jgi:hypothetical protein
MKFGIEIELYSPVDMSATTSKLSRKVRGMSFDTYGDNDWSMVGDGSLHGVAGFKSMELVSPVLDTENAADLRMVRKVCSALQAMGCMVNENCGLHVHVNADDLSVDQIKSVYSRYTKFENWIDLMVPSNRRGDRVYYTKGGRSMANNVESCQTRNALQNVQQGDRYFKVNLEALQRHGTIEFRQHSGSINGATILNWVDFLTSFVEASKPSTVAPVVRAPRGRRPSGTGMASGCSKVYNAFMASWHNGNGSLFLSTISSRTGLAESSVKVAISMLKTKHGVVIKKHVGQRGCANPLYFIANPSALPRLTGTNATSHTSTPAAPQDTVWRGISKKLKAYFMERMNELSGFNLGNVSL